MTIISITINDHPVLYDEELKRFMLPWSPNYFVFNKMEDGIEIVDGGVYTSYDRGKLVRVW